MDLFSILFIGDIVGRPGRRFIIKRVPELRQELHVDLVIANGENSAGGAGINAKIAHALIEAGVDAITLGDHVWDQKGFEQEIDKLDRVCRPANLPESCPGKTSLIVEKDGFRVGVFTVLGRQYLNIKSSCPFLCADVMIEKLRADCDCIIAEIHAEATSEKISIGRYLDGRAGVVAGSHTHVPTADCSILPRGTGYITDLGMSGPYDSCLGRDLKPVIGRFLDGLPRRFNVAENDVRLCGALFRINKQTGLCEEAERIEVSDG